MSNNLSQGPVLVADVTVSDINQALIALSERLDEAKGLRGRAMVFDRLRIEDPTADDDAVNLGKIQAGTAFANITFLAQSGASILAYQPGTAYVELSPNLDQQVNFASMQTLEARVVVQAWGTHSETENTGKGLAITQNDGTLIAEVVWHGSAEGLKVGEFTEVTLDTDQSVQIRVKGATATDNLLLQTIILDMRYAIDAITT